MPSLFKAKVEILNDYIHYLENFNEKDKYLDPVLLEVCKQCRLDLINREKEIKRKGINRYANEPYTVQLELTSRCNQKCIHCYNQSGIDKNHASDDISFEKWMGIAKQLAEYPVCQVIISGGEPMMLGRNLYALMDLFHEVGVQFIFITNGMLINKTNIKKLARYRYAWMQFSIDGSNENTHDYIRGAKGAFKKVINAACLARSHGIPVGMASVFIKRNINQVGELIDLGYTLGAYKVVCGNFMYAGRAVKNAKELELTAQDLKRADNIIIKKQKEYQGLMEIVKPLDPAMSLRMKLSQNILGILIRPNGEVRIDCQAPIRIGNALESTIKDIWEKYGKKSWEHSKTLMYIKEINNYKDLLFVKPRTHVEPDIDLTS